MTQALLYKYFASKADLTEAVFERVYLGRLDAALARFDADLDYARRKAETDPGFRVGEAAELPRDYTLHGNGGEP